MDRRSETILSLDKRLVVRAGVRQVIVEPEAEFAVRRGDLVFFNMKLSSKKKVDHVGIYLDAGYFAHASFSRGIIIDNLNSNYYRQRLQGIRRHPALGGGQ